MFDGETLDGWRGDAAYWSVKDGAITGASNQPIPENTFLIYGKSFSDFEIELKYRFLTAKGNSGLQYRSRMTDEEKFLMEGYQANMVTIDAKQRYAFLWDEEARRLLANLGEKVEINEKDGQMERLVTGQVGAPRTILIADKSYPAWNKLVVVAKDNKLRHMINGHRAVDVIDNDQGGRAMEGLFALQLHSGPAMGIQIKDIFIKELVTIPETNLSGGQALYAENCSVCHDNELPGFITTKEISKFSQKRIIDALLYGVMQSQVPDLDEGQAKSIAEYLTAEK